VTDEASEPNHRLQHVLDTGPLVSFGGVNGGPALLRDLLMGHVHWTADVAWELEHIGGPARLREAAATSRRQCVPWLPEPVEVLDLEAVEQVKADLPRFAQTRRQRETAEDPNKNHGEAASIVLARELRDRFGPLATVVLVCDEDAARALAEQEGFKTICSGELLRVAVARGLWSRQAAYQRYREMRTYTDPGVHFDSARDL